MNKTYLMYGLIFTGTQKITIKVNNDIDYKVDDHIFVLERNTNKTLYTYRIVSIIKDSDAKPTYKKLVLERFDHE